MTPLHLAFASAAAVALVLVSCTALLWRHRRGRLAASAPIPLDPPPTTLSDGSHIRWDNCGALVSTAKSDLARVSGLTLREAEDLLDWLEQSKHPECSLVCDNDDLFAVEFRLRPAHVRATAARVRRERPAKESPVG